MRVVNILHAKAISNVTMVDRSTPLGNPFVVDNHNPREKVVYYYREWLNLVFIVGNKVKPLRIAQLIAKEVGLSVSPVFVHKNWSSKNVINAFSNLKPNDVLGCYCKPKLCHADVIIELKEGTKMLNTTEKLNQFGALLGQLNALYQELAQELGNPAVAATVDRQAVQQMVAPTVQQTGTVQVGEIMVYLNQMPYQGNKVMLKGHAYVGDGSSTPIVLPISMWPSKPSSSTDYSGNMFQPGSKGRREDRVGGIFLYINEDNSTISATIEANSTVDGRYKGTVQQSTDTNWVYMCHMTVNDDEPQQAPLLQPLVNGAGTQQQLQVFTSNPNPAAPQQQADLSPASWEEPQPMAPNTLPPLQPVAQAQPQQLAATPNGSNLMPLIQR